MSVRIINNLGEPDHGRTLITLIAAADAVTIASPYLMPDLSKFLAQLPWASGTSLELITTLVPASEEQFRKISALHGLVSYAAAEALKVTISLNNRLHGKVYIFQKNGEFQAALISSANMTDNGLHQLHEWGVLLEDAKLIAKLHEHLRSAVEYREVYHGDIIRMYDEMQAYLKANQLPLKPKVELDLLRLVTGRAAWRLPEGIQYWLKPLGHAKGHVDPQESYALAQRRLTFAKHGAADVCPNDILIAFATGTGRVLAVFRALTVPAFDERVERWPWFIEGENLSPDYGANWWENGLTIYDLKEAYEQAYPEAPIKPRGAQTYGAFKWGKDRLRITPAFAGFIIDRILAHGAAPKQSPAT